MIVKVVTGSEPSNYREATEVGALGWGKSIWEEVWSRKGGNTSKTQGFSQDIIGVFSMSREATKRLPRESQ